MIIPYLNFDAIHDPLEKEMVKVFKHFLQSKWYVLGKGVEELEKSFASYHECDYAIGVASGLDAMIIALKVLGIGPGDEVIVPSNTYIATWIAVSAVGASLVPVEPNRSTLNIDHKKIEKAITKRTKAILPVHLYGAPCNMEKIKKIAFKNKLFIVEDNAQSIGASWKGKKTGSWGDINACSFYPGKNMGGLGDGGMITTNNKKWAEKCKMFRNYGSKRKYYNEVVGMNSRLDEVQARLISIKWPYLDTWNEERKTIAAIYISRLEKIKEIRLPSYSKKATHVFHIFPILTKKRNSLKEHLDQEGIQTLIHYPLPPHLQKAYKHLGFKKGAFPIAEKIARQELSLPIYPGLTVNQANYIADRIEFYFGKGR